ncbi:hypothetical protein [Streptomyces sp. NPDC001070]
MTTKTATVLPDPPAKPPRFRPDPRLAAVAAGYALLQLVLAVPHVGLGWDETVYVSQLNPRHPAAFFSAPRSRGISLLTAPFAAVTESTPVLRTALALLSAVALYAAFRVWRPLVGPGPVALAALLFGGLWVTVLYGPQAMPNLWVALAAVAAAGWFLRGLAPDAPRWVLVGLAGAIAAATLFRTPDGVWLALPLLAACAVVRGPRRPVMALAILAGLAVGGAEWIAEAYIRWGGIGARLHVSSATEGGMGAHWAGGHALRSLNGPLLCRPCDVPLTHPVLTLWWLALPILAAAACVPALRTGRPATTFLPVACAAALAVPYLLLIDYSAPRFLLPAYALLSLPIAAAALTFAARMPTVRARAVATGVMAALLVAHLAGQFTVLHHNVARARTTAGHYRSAADGLRRLGLRPPCLVTGTHALPVAYYGGCASAETSGNNRSTTLPALLRRMVREPSAVLTGRGQQPPRYARDWTGHRLAGTGWVAYVP